MSIAAGSARVAPTQVYDLVRDALRPMAAGFGFLESEDDA